MLRKRERLLTVDELIAAIMEANRLAKSIPAQDVRWAEAHKRLDELLQELEERAGQR